MTTASKEEISKNVESFFKLYLKEYLELIESNNHKIKDLEEMYYPELDFIFIFKFIRVELDHLKNIDVSIFDHELRKLYQHTAETVSELVKFKKEYIPANLLFRNYFSKSNSEAKTINTQFDKAKTEKLINTSKADRLTKEIKDLKKTKKSDEDTIKILKKLNSELADTLQNIENARNKLEKITIEKEDFDNKYLPVFLDAYKKISKEIVSKIMKQVGIFSFSIDKDMWKNASRSKKIMHFFETIKQSKNMNLQQYMEHHLNTQTSPESKDERRMKFRKKLIDAINKVKIFNMR